MLTTTFAIILLFLIFFIIGFGPTLLLLPSQNRFENTLALAPTVGIIITTLIGTYLVLLDYSINKWAFPWLITGISLSFILSIIAIKTNKHIFRLVLPKNIIFFVIGLLITIVLLLTPMLIGGLNFTILRGNGTDTFNYLTMAGYLIHEPYSWIQHASLQTIIDKNPSYFLARSLLGTRWSTPMILEWCTTITRIPLYRLEYGFTTMFFMMAYCCTFWYAIRMKIKPKFALLVALAISVGFWGQFVLDIRAMAQISALPLVLLLVYLLDVEDIQVNKKIGSLFLIAITFTAIIFLYVEILPLIALGLLFFIAIQVFQKKYIFKIFTNRSLIFPVTVFLTVLPSFNFLERFFHSQISFALYMKVVWYKAYFYWLYHYSFIGFWGFSYWIGKISKFHVVNFLFSISLILICILLTITLFYLILHQVIKKNKSFANSPNGSVAFVLAAFCLFLYLFSKNQLWAAGKGLSYGYPFWMLLIAFMLSSVWETWKNSNLKNILFLVAKYTVLIWFILQCTLGIQRIVYAKTQKEYKNYICNHGEYRKHDWNIDNLTKFLEKNNVHIIGLRISNNWVVEYLGLVLGSNFQVIDMNGVFDRDGSLIGKQDVGEIPEYIITEKKDFKPQLTQILAENNEFILIKNPGKLSGQYKN